MTDDLCPMCCRPMPEAKATGRPRLWCSDTCRKAARGRTPAELEANRQHLAEVNARLSASLRGIR